MIIKNIIFDLGGVLANPKTGHWFITPNFYHILDRSVIDKEKLNDALRKYLHLHTQNPKNEEEEYQMFSTYYYKVLEEIKYPNYSTKLADKLAYDCCYNDY